MSSCTVFSKTYEKMSMIFVCYQWQRLWSELVFLEMNVSVESTKHPDEFRLVFLLNIETESLHVTSRFPLLKWWQWETVIFFKRSELKLCSSSSPLLSLSHKYQWNHQPFLSFSDVYRIISGDCYCSYFWFRELNKTLTYETSKRFLCGLSGMQYLTTSTCIAQMTGPRFIKAGPDFKGVDVMLNMCLCHTQSSEISSHPTGAAISHHLLEEGQCYFS